MYQRTSRNGEKSSRLTVSQSVNKRLLGAIGDQKQPSKADIKISCPFTIAGLLDSPQVPPQSPDQHQSDFIPYFILLVVLSIFPEEVLKAGFIIPPK